MGKQLGKKARKFARKNLPSVLKNRRKFRSRSNSFKQRRYSTAAAAPVDTEGDAICNGKSLVDQSNLRNIAVNGVAGYSLFNTAVSEDEDLTELSDSDGYLSEDLDCPCFSEIENKDSFDEEDEVIASKLGQNKAIYLELSKQKEKLDMLKKKDPKFSEFLEKHKDAIEKLTDDESYSDEDGTSKKSQDSCDGLLSQKRKLITSLTVDVWCWLIVEEKNTVPLSGLLNGYRAACHYCTDGAEASLYLNISNGDVFSKILIFVLSEADDIFRGILGISDSCLKDDILKLKNSSQWFTARPLIKSYLRSTIFLLNQITDGQIIAFTLSRLRASISFFAAFPSLIVRLIKTVVHLWATGDETLSSASFLVIRDMCMQLSSECYENCLTKTYQAYLGCCNYVEPTNMKHIDFLGNSIVELYSLDVQNSYQKVLSSLHQLAAFLQQSFKTKQKEDLKKICCWQFAKSVEIWAQYVVRNVNDNDFEPLLYLIIQIVRVVPHLFPGPRYIPLRLRHIQLLNQLSSCSGVFIPIAYLLLDIFDTKGSSKSDSRPEIAISLLTTIKAPKQWLKSRNFHEECVVCAIELLSEHYCQWNYHVSFPDLAAIPLILMKRFHDNATSECIRRSVKRFIDQVQANTEYVQRKRDEVSFSPNDQASVDAFFLMEKASGNTPFTTYYNSIREKPAFRGKGMQ